MILVVFSIYLSGIVLKELRSIRDLGLRRYLKWSKLVVLFEVALCVSMVILFHFKDTKTQELLDEVRETRFDLLHTETYVNLRAGLYLDAWIQLTYSILILVHIVKLGLYAKDISFSK